jgi:hypothetical protein
MRQFLLDWVEAAIEAEEIVEAGDSVAVAVRQRAGGSGSGAPGGHALLGGVDLPRPQRDHDREHQGADEALEVLGS